MSPGPQQRLLHQVLGALPVAVDQPQGVGVQRVGVLVMQRAQQLGVVVADGALLASGARPAVRSTGIRAVTPNGSARGQTGCVTVPRAEGVHRRFTSWPTSAHQVLLASGGYAA